MSRINVVGKHRGFTIGWTHGIPPYVKGCWRGPNDLKWTEGGSYCDDVEDAARCARKCVDYRYRVEVFEFVNGREYDAIKDGLIEAFD